MHMVDAQAGCTKKLDAQLGWMHKWGGRTNGRYGRKGWMNKVDTQMVDKHGGRTEGGHTEGGHTDGRLTGWMQRGHTYSKWMHRMWTHRGSTHKWWTHKLDAKMVDAQMRRLDA